MNRKLPMPTKKELAAMTDEDLDQKVQEARTIMQQASSSPATQPSKYVSSPPTRRNKNTHQKRPPSPNLKRAAVTNGLGHLEISALDNPDALLEFNNAAVPDIGELTILKSSMAGRSRRPTRSCNTRWQASRDGGGLK